MELSDIQTAVSMAITASRLVGGVVITGCIDEEYAYMQIDGKQYDRLVELGATVECSTSPKHAHHQATLRVNGVNVYAIKRF